LKPDNIIVRDNGTLALVDYDGLFVPAMQGQQAREFGSAIYRHPKRTMQTYDRYIDDFSLLVLLLELRLVAIDTAYYNTSLSGDSMVAKAGDWDNLLASRIYQAMQAETLKGSIDWASWAAMLLITARSEKYTVADWSLLLDKEKQAIQKKNSIENANFSQNLGNGITLDMIFVEGGTFMMGSDDGHPSEAPIHSITLDSFYIGKFQITQAQWEAIMDYNPSYFKGNNLPVEQVSWDDAQEFIKKLNQKILPSPQRGKFRLLTEAEWEYAARGGNKSKGYKYAGSNNINEVAWYRENSDRKTHLVGQKKANELGIFDMSGNVWERCEDLFDEAYPARNRNESDRVMRGGGSWANGPITVTGRFGVHPSHRSDTFGFRVCLGY
jgi:formylglycine-generating enzyme required for sulfatase activity